MGRNYNGISINTSHNTHETVFSLLPTNKAARIIDIPSGAGAFVARLKDSGYTEVIAVDIDNILEIEHDHFVLGDMTERFPFEDNTLDVVVCIDGIEHISRQFDFIREAHRVLHMGGSIIISTPNISSLRSRWRWFATGHHNKCKSPLDENNPTPLHHIGMVSFPELRYMLHRHGFSVETVTANRIKAISWLYALFAPLSYGITKLVYNKTGKKDGTTAINREVFQQMFSLPVLFGETMIVKAVKTSSGKS